MPGVAQLASLLALMHAVVVAIISKACIAESAVAGIEGLNMKYVKAVGNHQNIRIEQLKGR